MIVEGSSPRGRGKPRSYSGEDRPAGLIPAWAGKTVPPTLIRLDARAHPRVGGENAAHALAEIYARGSSPRGRGKQWGIGGGLVLSRLIPAWAGKTWSTPPPAHPTRAHPRVGGENFSMLSTSSHPLGSSPRGRGKHLLVGGALAVGGLIPAWAGKTWPLPSQSGTRRAHPRVGGENMAPAQSIRDTPGSSPRGRGKPRRVSALAGDDRLIPAWAGKTRGGRAERPHHQAHPRVGGENAAASGTLAGHDGSSPRGRGKPDATQPVEGVTTAHPRVGGENHLFLVLPAR